MGLGANPFQSLLAQQAAAQTALYAANRKQQVAKVSSQTLIQNGRTLVTIPAASEGDAAAEVIVTVPFYNAYTDEPAFAFGSVLAPGQVLTTGAFPTISGTVATWTTTKASGQISGYTGATVAFVVSGPSGLQIYCTYSFIGTGIMIPTVVSTSGTGNA
jgi:hypothetical protein